jgi:CHASE2 domain-containing sensor protein
VTPIVIFLVCGFVAMSAALSAGRLNKLPEEERKGALVSKNVQVSIIFAGNLAALTLIGALAYGVRHLEWWIPVVCAFISFPVVHVIIFDRLFSPLVNLCLMMALVIVAIPTLYIYW